jgi:hypothetical protein
VEFQYSGRKKNANTTAAKPENTEQTATKATIEIASIGLNVSPFSSACFGASSLPTERSYCGTHFREKSLAPPSPNL